MDCGDSNYVIREVKKLGILTSALRLAVLSLLQLHLLLSAEPYFLRDYDNQHKHYEKMVEFKQL